MTVIGLDQSTTKTGWSLFEDGEYMDSGVIDLSAMKKDSANRALVMAEQICNLIDDKQPDKVAIEDIFDNNNVATLVLLGRLQGMLMLHCYEKGIPCEVLAPASWRSVVGIKEKKRDECKTAAVQFIKNRFYVYPVSTDEAEAVCIGYVGYMKK